MPYPLVLAALALSAAGTGAQMIGQGEAQSARKAAVGAEMRRQSGYRKDAQAVADQSISESGRDVADPGIANAAAERAAKFNAIVNQGQGSVSGNTVNRNLPTTTSVAGGSPQAGQSASAAAWNRILGGAQARVGGYTDWGLARNIAAKRAGQKLDTIGANARASANLLQLDLADAANAGENWQLGGQVLGAAGSVLGAYGATAPSASYVPGVGNVAGTAGVDYSPQMLQWGSLPA